MSSQLDVGHHPAARGRGVTAVLGPTNTGKTHLAIERMLGHKSGIIGLPLRLLAREVYARCVERVGTEAVALITGEEKVKPANPRYWVSTVEAMPRDLDVAFVAVDEVQIAADLERGHVFTDRILRRRGREETLLLGAGTMRGILSRLMPGLNVISRPRLSQLSYAGEKKITRLPRRSAVVAFAAEEVYAIAELIRRQRGGAAVVLGALSPRTRNAQVEMYQAGDVDFLVATDAIGMGLNLDVEHVAFASRRKFDGWQFRDLNPAEMGQVAGRAGRHMKDGTFGVTGRVDPLEPDLVARLEGHDFAPVELLQWRNPKPDFTSLDALQESLAVAPGESGLTRAPAGDDVRALETVAREPEIMDMVSEPAAVELLWDVCQVPDYRKIAPANHAELVAAIYRHLRADGVLPDDWFAAQVGQADHTDGDIDTLSNRIAHIRTWTFVANRGDWLADPAHWQDATRAVEDRLSDALHERLIQRFVDRRTAVLARRLRENTALAVAIDATGEVEVEGQHVGRLDGLRFTPDPSADGQHGKAVSAAARKGLAGELVERAEAMAGAPDTAFSLALDGTVAWQGATVGRLEKGERHLAPGTTLMADELLAGAPRERAEARLSRWIEGHIAARLGPLVAIQSDEGLSGLARGIGFQLVETLGVLDRQRVAEEVRKLAQEERAGLRRHGVRFGAHHIYLPALIKPGPRILAAQLWALHHGGLHQPGFAELSGLAASGRMSITLQPGASADLHRVLGYRACGDRAIRVDILERLADLIRAALAWRPESDAEPPAGAVDGRVFAVSDGMTSLVGCAGDDFAQVLTALGYRSERRPRPAPAAPLAATDGTPAEPLTDQHAPSAPDSADPPVGIMPAAPDNQPSGGDEISAPVSAGSETADISLAAPIETPPAPITPPSQPTEIVVWRPGRRGQGQRGPAPKRATAGHRESTAGKGDGGKQARPPKGGKRGRPPSGKPGRAAAARPPRPAKEPDPLSPFAALAGLRDQLTRER